MQLEFVEKYNKIGIPPELVVIWLHGLGADCNDFVPLIPQLNLDKSVKFIFPNAPMIPITINNGYVMRGWYDIIDLTRMDGAVIDHDGITKSVNSINQLIESEISNGFKSEQIILAGFSQGGVISLATGLRSKHQLGGIIGLSCYLPDVTTLVKEYPQNQIMPIFMAHGLYDPVIPVIAGKNSYQCLNTAGFNIKWHEYPMEHSVCNEETQDIAKWFQNL